MDKYEQFTAKYASYEDKYMEKTALIESLIPHLAQNVPSLAPALSHIPEGALGLAGIAGKYTLLKGAFKGLNALREAKTLSRRFGGGITDGLKMRGTPAANLALGKGLNSPSSKAMQTLRKVDKGTDVASVLYNGALIGKNLV